MESLYFKFKHKYINDTTSKQYTYMRIEPTGKITKVSLNKNSITNPDTITFNQKLLEPITMEEFKSVYNRMVKFLKHKRYIDPKYIATFKIL